MGHACCPCYSTNGDVFDGIITLDQIGRPDSSQIRSIHLVDVAVLRDFVQQLHDVRENNQLARWFQSGQENRANVVDPLLNVIFCGQRWTGTDHRIRRRWEDGIGEVAKEELEQRRGDVGVAVLLEGHGSSAVVCCLGCL